MDAGSQFTLTVWQLSSVTTPGTKHQRITSSTRFTHWLEKSMQPPQISNSKSDGPQDTWGYPETRRLTRKQKRRQPAWTPTPMPVSVYSKRTYRPVAALTFSSSRKQPTLNTSERSRRDPDFGRSQHTIRLCHRINF